MQLHPHSSPKREAPFSIRLTEDERTLLDMRSGSMPLASYIKSVLFADDAPKYRKRSKAPVTNQKALAELLARLGASRSASNLNQIAKAANQGGLFVDEDLIADLNRACAEVAWMRATLLQALGKSS